MNEERYKRSLRSTRLLILCVVICLVGCFGGFSLGTAQDQPDKLDKLLFLVARDVIKDPIFNQSAIVMLPASSGADNRLVVGLVINKPARVSLSQFFPNDPVLNVRTETVYLGGPIDAGAPSIIFRSPKPVKQATLLVGDVFVSFDSEFIKGFLKEPKQAQEFRLFAGRAQWTPGQLQNEVLLNAWYPVRADSGMIFSNDPQYIWRTLFELAQPTPLVKFPDIPGGVGAGSQDLVGDGKAAFR